MCMIPKYIEHNKFIAYRDHAISNILHIWPVIQSYVIENLIFSIEFIS